MPVRSAGILLYRGRGVGTEVFLVHPGGPYWAKKDDGAWSVPKGIVELNEDELAAACREFEEETGFKVAGKFRELGTFRQPSGKRLSVWALEGDCEPSQLVSNRFEMTRVSEIRRKAKLSRDRSRRVVQAIRSTGQDRQGTNADRRAVLSRTCRVTMKQNAGATKACRRHRPNE